MLFTAIAIHSIAIAMVLQCNLNSEIREPLETAPAPASRQMARAEPLTLSTAEGLMGWVKTNKTENLAVL